MPMTHSGVYSPAYSLLFESEISTYTNDTLNNTLYSNHYQNYVEAIFNIKRRTMKVSAKLPIQIITQLDLNDIITIDKLDYRINNFKYNLLTGLTQLELINGFDKFETNDVILPTECFIASNLGGQYRFNIPNIEDYTITSSVVGGGTTVGNEKINNGHFDGNANGWSLQSGWSYNNNRVSKVSNSPSFISQNQTLDSGKYYRVTYSVLNVISGSVKFAFAGGGNNVNGTERSEDGTYSQIVEGDSNTSFRIIADSDFLGTVDSISVKEVSGDIPFVTDSVRRNQLILDVDAWTSIPIGTYSRTTNLVFTTESEGEGDVIKNGGFTEGTNGSRFWYANPSNSFTFNNGYAEGTGVSGANLIQLLDAPLIVGCEYLVTYTVSNYTSGWIDCFLGGSARSQTVSSNGVKSQYVTATVASTSISFTSIEFGSFVGRISDVSIIGCKTVIKDEGGMCVTQINEGL